MASGCVAWASSGAQRKHSDACTCPPLHHFLPPSLLLQLLPASSRNTHPYATPLPLPPSKQKLYFCEYDLQFFKHRHQMLRHLRKVGHGQVGQEEGAGLAAAAP